MSRALLVGLGSLLLSGCSSGSSPAPAPTVSQSPRAESPAPLARPLRHCPRPDAKALGAAIGGSWSVTATKRPRGLCRRRLTGPGGSSLQVTISATSSSAKEVARLGATPPPVPEARVLGSLDVGTSSVGVSGHTGSTTLQFVEVGTKRVLVSIVASLPDAEVRDSPLELARRLGRWGLAQGEAAQR